MPQINIAMKINDMDTPKKKNWYKVRFWKAQVTTLQKGAHWVLKKGPSAMSVKSKMCYRQDVLECLQVVELSKAQYLAAGGVL